MFYCCKQAGKQDEQEQKQASTSRQVDSEPVPEWQHSELHLLGKQKLPGGLPQQQDSAGAPHFAAWPAARAGIVLPAEPPADPCKFGEGVGVQGWLKGGRGGQQQQGQCSGDNTIIVLVKAPCTLVQHLGLVPQAGECCQACCRDLLAKSRVTQCSCLGGTLDKAQKYAGIHQVFLWCWQPAEV